MRWRVYYADGSTYSDRDGDAFHAPTAGVQVVVMETPSGAPLRYGKDAYYWREDVGWQACDTPGLWDYLLMYVGPKAILIGRSIRDEDFWRILERAQREGLGDA